MFAETISESSVESSTAPPPLPQGPDARNPRTCVTCKRRKVKCDRRAPCSNCIKAQIQCRYPPPGRAPRQPRRGARLHDNGQLPELVDQVWALMARVMEQKINLQASRGHSPTSDPSSQLQKGILAGGPGGKLAGARAVGMDEGMGSRSDLATRDTALNLGHAQAPRPAGGATGRRILEEEKNQYISNPFWASMSEIKEGIQELLEDRDDESDEDSPFMPNDVPAESNHHGFIMGYQSTDVDLKRLHPPRSQISLYWKTFNLNVNPLTRLVHMPTMDKFINKVLNSLDALNESSEALMFSIYFSTVVSMSDEDVNTTFGAERDYLLRRYRFGIEQALAKAKFLETAEIETLQAFVLFLVCVRRIDDTRFVWTLTGLAVRLARALGLHRDGTKLGLSPFDTEVRRRIWWQLCLLDSRDSEDHGFELTIGEQSFDTEYPLSINDADIEPGGTEIPIPKTGLSDMTVSLLRYELCHMQRKLFFASAGRSALPNASAPMDFEDRERMVQETADYLEKQYLQYCVNAESLEWTVATISRLSILTASIRIYQPLTHPGKAINLPQGTKDRLLMAAIEVVEYVRTLETEPASNRVSWLWQTYSHWHAVAFILTELAVRPPGPVVERAWRAVFIFRDAAGNSSRTGMLWQPLRRLLAQAMQKREENKRLTQQEHLGSGMESQYARPPPQGLQTTPYYFATPTPTISNPNPNYQIPINPYATVPGMFIQSQYTDVAPSFSSGHVNMPLQSQQQVQMQQQQQQQQQLPFLVDDAAMQGLRMSNLDVGELGEDNWDSWNQLVQGYHLEPNLYL